MLNLATRKKDRKNEVTELIAFITPTVLRTQEEEAAATVGASEALENIQSWRPLKQAAPAEAPVEEDAVAASERGKPRSERRWVRKRRGK